MSKWYLRMAVYILTVVGLHLFFLAFFLSETIITPEMRTEQLFIGISFLVFFIVLSVLIFYLMRKMLQPLGEITDLVKDINAGHYWRRIHMKDGEGAPAELAREVNQLALHLQQAREYENMHADRLQAIIRHMASGLLYIDQKGKIVMTNDVLLSMLCWEHDYDQTLYYESPLPEEVVTCIQQVLTFEEEMKQYIAIDANTKRLDIDLLVAPVKDMDENVTGIVLVFHDVTDLKQLEETRKDFVANVSHELKTPVTSIKGFSETLLDGAMYQEEHLKEFLEIIRKESDRLYRLIQDLLELSHIEQKKMQLYWEKVDLRELIEDTLLLVQSKAREKQIDLVFQYAGFATVEGDRDRLRQVFLNLLSNAVQYTPEHGQVEVTISKWLDEDESETGMPPSSEIEASPVAEGRPLKGYRVCIIDNGIGLNAKDIPRIFERFYRVDRARSRASGGTGLGLAIVKHLVEAHHGEMTVESVEGEGSKFCVYLHATQGAAESIAAPAVQSVG